MYTLYIPKYKGDNPPHFVKTVVNAISQYCLDKNSPFGIFMAPGYLSQSEHTIQDFTSDFPFSSLNNSPIKNSYLGIFRGMNSQNIITLNNGQPDTILNVHSKEYKNIGNNWINLSCKAHKEDHRKMLFVFSLDYSCKTTIPLKIDKTNIDAFLKLVNVNFVLIGSSNQSHNTYFTHATKGEADILLFTEQSFLDVLYNHAQKYNVPINADSEGNTPSRSCILSSSNEIRSPKGNIFKTPSNNFLKNILKEYMDNTLSI